MEQLLGLPPDGAAHGPAIDNLIGLVHWLMFLLFVGWGIFYVATLIRFRKSKHPKADYAGVKSHVSSYLEVGVLVVEVILLVAFSIPLWSKRVDAFPDQKDAVVVRIVAEQFAWNVHYPGKDGKFGKTSISLIDGENPLGLDRSDPDAKDDITTINQLNLPVDKPVIIYLSTKDVIHSLNIPTYRVKQDAIPGQLVPVWFTPVKTTDQIREEFRRTFSVADAMKRVRTLTLPAMSVVRVARGASMDDRMVMQDVPDAQGGTILSKGDHLTAENMGKLADANIAQVPVRPVAALDKYFLMEEAKDSAGNPVVPKNDPLSEDAVSKLVGMGKHEVSVRLGSGMDIFVVMDTIRDQSGNQIAAKGDPLTEDVITKLGEAGIGDVSVSPATPTEIACAQLCGLGHYRMRGYVTVQTPGEYQKWFDDQEAALAPPPAQSSADTTAAPSATDPAAASTKPGEARR